MAQKPSIPKGTRDFSPAEMMRRTYIFETVKKRVPHIRIRAFRDPRDGEPLHPAGKYGDEGDKLLFKILNSGDYAAGLADAEVRSASRICEKGLRYDLTVPFARYVVQHQGEITFPVQALPDSARMARRPSAEGPLSRVLPVRRGCHWVAVAAQRSGAHRDRGAHFRQAGNRSDA